MGHAAPCHTRRGVAAHRWDASRVPPDVAVWAVTSNAFTPPLKRCDNHGGSQGVRDTRAWRSSVQSRKERCNDHSCGTMLQPTPPLEAEQAEATVGSS